MDDISRSLADPATADALFDEFDEAQDGVVHKEVRARECARVRAVCSHSELQADSASAATRCGSGTRC
eukprot:7046294-Prymnesium_polylepis.1